ncbi:MAG TPA: DnaJ domain-containing protein, partial [Ktedonobacterales bacterium]
MHRAYRRLAKLWHPDRYALAPAALRARAERRMSALNRAYAVLGDPLARSVYDRDRRLAANPYITIGGAPRAGHARGGAPPSHAEEPLPRSAFGNPNGAGEFFAILCLLLALCFLAW